ncbi:BZ3500_MvSof-1268-A1-R1_Chr2-1g04438 [Microbotryum saponariae]|uniref:sphingolipid C(9)-methyltransferase n=1 Tax=Microbotryum saponariae TaxID=289078 RepID=A0A2X0M2U9_9BASI|nr:BZ3500_MvSof-1268-A1-R1_Chr2-1g04438 [Microbotryum saponariae]SCZ91705.1 BZ3501_MvSof-1269-A2-R1_Chr2-1g04094 [Microbotryum saponariae]
MSVPLFWPAPSFDANAGVKITSRAAIANAPFPIESNGSFSNLTLAAIVLLAPYLVARWVPLLPTKWSYYLLFLPVGLASVLGYWMLMSRIGGKKRDYGTRLPGKPLEYYVEIKDAKLAQKYSGGRAKIPVQTFYDAYFAGKIDLKGDMLELLEQRHDWASFEFTWDLLKYVLTVLIPDVVWHSPSQDEEQVRDHYDRGDDFYSWFLGPRMIYTSGVINDIDRKETLEELQDNKLALVCHKLELKPTDTLLDIGCGWGTLVTYAAKNFGCDATGVTLGKNQTKFGNKRIADNGCDASRARILCKDYREIGVDKKFSKIVSLEMAEHVGIRNYNSFLRQVYNLLEDDGILVFQVAGIRPHWQYEDLIWGLFMNKYVFPGADASCALNWVIGRLEGAGFEIKSVDVLGVHYSATLHRWYENWMQNRDAVTAKYGDRWYRIWLYFLASAVITSRQGGASVFQISAHKNLNSYHRVEAIPSHTSLFFKPAKEPS